MARVRQSRQYIFSTLRNYALDNEKMKRILLENSSSNLGLSWLTDILWQNRSTLIRTVGLGIGRVLSLSSSGAEFLTSNRKTNQIFWLKIVSILMDRTECSNARSESANIMTNLLKSSIADARSWYGPALVEPVSGILVDGEGALFNFLEQTRLDRELVDILQTFAVQHSPKWQNSSNSIDDNSHSHLSFPGNQTDNSTLNNEITEKSTNAIANFNDNDVFGIESSTTPVLITSIHKLLLGF